MNPEKRLSISDIAQELNYGMVTLKFILKRFRSWLPFERIDGHHYYARNIIPVLIKIQDSLEAGLLPSEIDQELKTGPQKLNPETASPITAEQKTDTGFLEQPNQDIRVSKDGLTLIKSLFDDIALQQNRVATAHEKRAKAEERKAAAIEKRAEAEEKKAIAMNNIATALQEMNHHRSLDSHTREMAHKAAQVLTLDETHQEMDLTEVENRGLNDTEELDYPEIFDSPDPSMDLLESSEIQMDDLSDLISEEIFLEESLLDDLSLLLDAPEPAPDDMDDLSALIDTDSNQTSPKTQLSLDDLSRLDDLSLLIEDSASLEPPELDDLSLLIQDPIAKNPPPVELDDLSALISSDAKIPDPLPPADDPPDNPMDDLSVLINDTPSLRPDITPQENLKAYKAAVMKIILGLKTQNLSAQETTRRLNQDKVQTISGKSQWSETAISQIYKFIDSAT